jgi:hypothetical protein
MVKGPPWVQLQDGWREPVWPAWSQRGGSPGTGPQEWPVRRRQGPSPRAPRKHLACEEAQVRSTRPGSVERLRSLKLRWTANRPAEHGEQIR